MIYLQGRPWTWYICRHMICQKNHDWSVGQMKADGSHGPPVGHISVYLYPFWPEAQNMKPKISILSVMNQKLFCMKCDKSSNFLSRTPPRLNLLTAEKTSFFNLEFSFINNNKEGKCHSKIVLSIFIKQVWYLISSPGKWPTCRWVHVLLNERPQDHKDPILISM